MAKRAVFKQWYEDTPGGKYVRRVGTGRYHIIEWTDMDDACGSDNEGHPRYVVELSEVDVTATPAETLQSAIESCGWEGIPDNPEAQAETLHSYGARAPLHSGSGNNLRKIMRKARAASLELTEDPDVYDEAMSRPVNALGSTAREFMQGDINSAMVRGIQQGDASEETLDRVAASPPSTGAVSIQANLKRVPSDDPLAYVSGFMAGLAGRALDEPRNELAPAYVEGYHVGVCVKAGDTPKPEWVKG